MHELLCVLVHRVNALSEKSYLILSKILIDNSDIRTMIMILLHDHGYWNSLCLSDFLSKCSPSTEYLPVLLCITIGKAPIGISRFDDLHVTLETSVIFS